MKDGETDDRGREIRRGKKLRNYWYFEGGESGRMEDVSLENIPIH